MAKYATSPIPAAGYGAVLADPAWPWDAFSDLGLGRCGEAHYDTMSVDDIGALWAEQDLGGKVARHAWLFLWCTWPRLADGSAHRVLADWGFRGVTGLPWVKTAQNGQPIRGTGHILRGITEPLLIAKRGRPKVRALADGLILDTDAMEAEARAYIMAERRLHSQKPDAQYDLIETLAFGPGLELFARGGERQGWHKSGNQVGKLS